MSQSETKSKSTESESELEVIGKENGPEGEEFIVKHRQTGNIGNCSLTGLLTRRLQKK